MKLRSFLLTLAVTATGLSGAVFGTSAYAQAKEQFFPVLPYRTGAYAPNGVPWANGYVDYFVSRSLALCDCGWCRYINGAYYWRILGHDSEELCFGLR